MTRMMVRRLVIVGTLAVLLSVSGTGAAQARDLRSAGSTWGWLGQVWTKGVAALWGWAEVLPSGQHSKSVGGLQYQGPGLDPNSPTANPACSTCSDEGYGLDPNGK